MGAYEAALREYLEAVYLEFESEEHGCAPAHIRDRRIAATTALHAVMDPWNDCLCADCLVSRETRR